MHFVQWMFTPNSTPPVNSNSTSFKVLQTFPCSQKHNHIWYSYAMNRSWPLLYPFQFQSALVHHRRCAATHVNFHICICVFVYLCICICIFVFLYRCYAQHTWLHCGGTQGWASVPFISSELTTDSLLLYLRICVFENLGCHKRTSSIYKTII